MFPQNKFNKLVEILQISFSISLTDPESMNMQILLISKV